MLFLNSTNRPNDAANSRLICTKSNAPISTIHRLLSLTFGSIYPANKCGSARDLIQKRRQTATFQRRPDRLGRWISGIGRRTSWSSFRNTKSGAARRWVWRWTWFTREHRPAGRGVGGARAALLERPGFELFANELRPRKRGTASWAARGRFPPVQISLPGNGSRAKGFMAREGWLSG